MSYKMSAGSLKVVQDECLFIILGGAGDLTKRKLIPALYKLLEDGRIRRVRLLCVSIEDISIDEILDRARSFIAHPNESLMNELRSHAHYFRMDFHDAQSYEQLKLTIESLEQRYDVVGNRLFYFATMPEHFDVLTKNLARSGIARPNKDTDASLSVPWSRLVYEKPFGNDRASAEEINDSIERAFHESQVFRIDHYLGKELVSNIALVRFTNRILEPLWNKDHIESVQIILNENIGIEGRGRFYDSYGALKDMVQSHMLQILALVGMEPPKLLQADYIRDAKAAVLQKVSVASMIRAQYEGYCDEPHVKPDSTTETFVALKCMIHNDRWSGVPFYLKTGKFLDRKEASIHIRFKHVPCLLNVCPSDTNCLTIKIHPDEGMYLEINVKVPGVSDRVMPISMEFAHHVMFGPNTPEAYEILLTDVIARDHASFVRADEIAYSWKIIEEALQKKSNLYSYKKGSKGPSALYLLDQEREIRWRA